MHYFFREIPRKIDHTFCCIVWNPTKKMGPISWPPSKKKQPKKSVPKKVISFSCSRWLSPQEELSSKSILGWMKPSYHGTRRCIPRYSNMKHENPQKTKEMSHKLGQWKLMSSRFLESFQSFQFFEQHNSWIPNGSPTHNFQDFHLDFNSKSKRPASAEAAPWWGRSI